MKRGRSRRKKNQFNWKLLGVGAVFCFVLAVYCSNLVFATKKDNAENSVRETQEKPGDIGTENTDLKESHVQEVSESEKKVESETAEAVSDLATVEEKAQKLLEQLTLEQRTAQLFIILPESLTGVSVVTGAGQTTKAALEKYPVGGLIYMKNNIKNPPQLKEMTSRVQKFAIDVCGIPLFLAVDEEGGEITRIASNPEFPVPEFDKMWKIGETGDPSRAYEVGDSIGTYLSEYGLNFDFAPEGDVLSNPENKVIGTRSFGSDPALVSAMSQQVIAGLEKHKVQYSIKHFPGHGATVGDTHEGFAYIDKTLEEMMECELVPFADAIAKGADCIMVGHISVPKVTGDNTPASLSSVMITDVLRNQMGFQGVVVTDALNMGAIQNYYNSGEAAVKSFLAGADLLLMPADFEGAYQAVLSAVKTGSISEERLNESVLRILKMKCKFME